MIEILLSKGLRAVLDDCDAHLAAFKWTATSHSDGRRTVYAVRKRRKNEGPGPRKIALHRAVLAAPEGIEVDHINGDGLDCRRSNLRLATHAQNMANRRVRRDSRSGLRGVMWHKRSACWHAEITVAGRTHSLGYFATAEAAARAYDAAALKYFGVFARPNFPPAPEVLP